MRSAIFVVMGLALSAGTAIGQTPVQGVWADEDQQHVYAFLENDQLSYWNKTKYHSDPEKSYVRSDGTWQAKAKEPMCWLGKRTGNVMLYANGQKCCMEVEASGDKLILVSVWGEPQTDFGICRDQVLSRIESAPDLSLPGTAAK